MRTKRFVHFLSTVFLLLVTGLAVSGVGFTIRQLERYHQDDPVATLEADLNLVRGVKATDQVRRREIRRIMELIDRYNTTMPSSLKYTIASEIYNMAQKYENLNVDLICATITHESARTWNPQVVSNVGAMGLMQIMPSTGKFLCQFENFDWTSPKDVLFDPVKNIRLGCRYLSTLIEFYGVEGGLAAYNGGEKRAAMWLANNKADGILWQETQNYVPAVMRLYSKFKN